jgi:hypothetical protein
LFYFHWQKLDLKYFNCSISFIAFNAEIKPFLFSGKFSPGIVRCGTHSDYGIVTFLFQDEAGGLEVQGVDKVKLHFGGMKLHLAFDPGT